MIKFLWQLNAASYCINIICNITYMYKSMLYRNNVLKHISFTKQFFNNFVSLTEASNQNSKSATIEMYAPSSYNDTVTGETLSSVSEKSDSYSNEGSQPDYMVIIYYMYVAKYLHSCIWLLARTGGNLPCSVSLCQQARV